VELASLSTVADRLFTQVRNDAMAEVEAAAAELEPATGSARSTLMLRHFVFGSR